MNDPLRRRAGLATWELPTCGALTLVSTVSQQPDPATRFEAWSEYVTTDWFYASHIGASILGLALGTVGVVGLGIVLTDGNRPRAAVSAMALHVLGAAVLLALFGVAAFAQPAIGDAFLSVLQPIGSVLLIVTGALIAIRLAPAGAASAVPAAPAAATGT